MSYLESCHVPNGSSHKRRASAGRFAATVSLLFLVVSLSSPAYAAPVIDVWYGNTQSFGQIGQPQPYVNILGNVADAVSLEYELNGGPAIPLSIGSDGRRLLRLGDFNIDIHVSDLLAGANTVVIRATGGGTVTDTVTVNYTPGTVWPGSYSIDWSTLASIDEIQDVAQVVDGKWMLDNGNVRTQEWGYDRLIGIGDVTWQDYEVLVPVTIHSMAANHGIGILFRWNGHTDVPVVCPQPHCGWFPLGGLLWYEIGCLKVYANFGEVLDSDCLTLNLGVKYWFKGRVETNQFGGLYKLKVWQDGQPEPGAWNVIGQETLADPQTGSMLLLAHMSDVSFGEVTITELVPPPNQPPVANTDRVYVAPGGTAVVDVLRNDTDLDGFIDPATVTVVSYPAHGTVTIDTLTGAVTYDHDASPTLVDDFTYTVDDDDAQTSNEATVFVTITNDPQPAFFSDDFNACALDASLWTYVDFLGDGWYDMVGGGSGDAYISLSVPDGRVHDVWGGNGLNEAPRVMQWAEDGDFEFTAKFNTEPTGSYQNQGIIIEQDALNFIRYDVFHTGASLRAHIGTTTNGVNAPVRDTGSPPGGAYYMRVVRSGDTFTMYRSGDGAAWTLVDSPVYAMNVTSIGVYAANPVFGVAYTAEVDFFEHVAIPLVDEDGALNTLLVDALGGGSVSPPTAAYACGDTIVLTATPDMGFSFVGWSGDLTGTTNPDTLVCTGPMQVTATFTSATAVGDDVPMRYELLGARPNPFNPSTRILFRVPVQTDVAIDIFDVRGSRIRQLVDRSMAAGEHAVLWDGRNDHGQQVGSGVYFYRVRAGQINEARKIVLLK